MKRSQSHLDNLHRACGAKCQPHHPNNAHQLIENQIPVFLIGDSGGWSYSDLADGVTRVLDSNPGVRYTAQRDGDKVHIRELVQGGYTELTFSTDFIDSNFNILINPNNFEAFLQAVIDNSTPIE